MVCQASQVGTIQQQQTLEAEGRTRGSRMWNNRLGGKQQEGWDQFPHVSSKSNKTYFKGVL